MVLRAQRILSPGTRIGGYRIEAEVGRGAMAVVYRAIQLNLERRVALKVLADELAADAEFAGRFFNEARAAAALSHAHIVQAYDAGIAEGNVHFFAMEYVEGETLQQRIRRQGYLRPGPGIELAIDIADALNYGWQRQRLTHGDIKPENIMINQAGECKLADFGLAKVAGHDVGGSDILLTPLYAAPEVIRGQRQRDDCRGDIYSFGATLYHMFAGTPPYPGEKAQEVMQRHLHEPLEALRQRNPAVPGRISDLVGSMLAKEASQRPGDWESVLRSLRDIRKALTEPPAPNTITAAAVHLRARDVRRAKTVVRPRRSAALGWVVLVAVLAALLAGAIVVRRQLAQRAGGSPHGQAGALSGGAGSPAPVPPAAGGTAPEVGAGGAEDWPQVRAAAQQAESPARALALVEGYGQRHPTTRPADYAAVVAQYADAAKARPPAPGTGPGGASVAAGGLTAGTGGATDPTPTPPTAKPKAPAEADGAARLAAALAPAPGDPPADAFVAYMAQLGRLEYAVPVAVEPVMTAAQKWLLDYPEDTPERAQVAFTANTVLPALEEVLPKLAANSQALAGTKLAGREYSRCTVREVTLTGMALQEQTQHGVMLRSLPWPRVTDLAPVLIQLSRAVAGNSVAWADRRPWLALLLFSGNGKLLDEACDGLPETPEKADWLRLRAALGRAPDEGKALRLWQKARDAVAAGERTSAYRLVGELQATRTHVSERYAKRCELLSAELAGVVPDVVGGRWVREAGDLATKDPTNALVKLLLAANRCGDVDFPEKARMDRIRRAALSALPLPDWLDQQVRRVPQAAVVPFGQPVSDGIPCLSLRVHQVASEAAAGSAPRVVEALSALEGPAWLELGDWAAAARLEARLQDSALATLPDAGRAAAGFSRGLLSARYGVVSEKAVVGALLRASSGSESAGEGPYAMLAQALAFEYGLFLRSGEADLALYLPGGQAPTPRGPPAVRARVLLDAAALVVERRQAEAASRVFPVLARVADGAADWGLSEAEAGLVQEALAKEPDSRALAAALARLPGRETAERHLRMAVAAALVGGAFADELWLRLTEWANLKGNLCGPVGGTAIYDAVVARVGQRLAAGDLAGARDTAAWGLSLTPPCLAPYYPRLVLVHWGLARLQAPAGARELADLLEAAAVANRTEKALGRMLLNDGSREKAREAVRDSVEGRFWFEWLVACDGLGPSPKAESAKLPERFSAPRLPRAEQVLADGLVQWAARGSSPQRAP